VPSARGLRHAIDRYPRIVYPSLHATTHTSLKRLPLGQLRAPYAGGKSGGWQRRSGDWWQATKWESTQTVNSFTQKINAKSLGHCKKRSTSFLFGPYSPVVWQTNCSWIWSRDESIRVGVEVVWMINTVAQKLRGLNLYWSQHCLGLKETACQRAC